jgi:transposase-like protein
MFCAAGCGNWPLILGRPSGQGQMKPEQQEIERLRREVAKLKAERDILKKAAAYFAKEAI